MKAEQIAAPKRVRPPTAKFNACAWCWQAFKPDQQTYTPKSMEGATYIPTFGSEACLSNFEGYDAGMAPRKITCLAA